MAPACYMPSSSMSTSSGRPIYPIFEQQTPGNTPPRTTSTTKTRTPPGHPRPESGEEAINGAHARSAAQQTSCYKKNSRMTSFADNDSTLASSTTMPRLVITESQESSQTLWTSHLVQRPRLFFSTQRLSVECAIKSRQKWAYRTSTTSTPQTPPFTATDKERVTLLVSGAIRARSSLAYKKTRHMAPPSGTPPKRFL